MKQYFTGFFTAVCLTASVFLFMGSQIKNLGDIDADSIKLTSELGTTYLLAGGIILENKDGNHVLTVAIGDGGGGHLTTFNADGKKMSYLGTGEGGGGHLETFNVHEKMTGYFGTGENNDGVAILFDRYGDGGWTVSGKQ